MPVLFRSRKTAPTKESADEQSNAYRHSRPGTPRQLGGLCTNPNGIHVIAPIRLSWPRKQTTRGSGSASRRGSNPGVA